MNPNTRVPYDAEPIVSWQSYLLKWKSFFSELSTTCVTDFEAVMTSALYPAGAVLFLEKQLPQGIFVLCSGKIKLSICSSAGKTIILKIVKPGDVLGLMATVTGNPHEGTAKTLHPCHVFFVQRDYFLRFIAKHPEANAEVVRQLCSSYLGACEQLRTVGLSATAHEKLARVFLRWSADGETTKKGTKIRYSFTHEEIAEFIGTTRETVTRTLNDFKHRQLVVVRGSTLMISNRAGLESICGI